MLIMQDLLSAEIASPTGPRIELFVINKGTFEWSCSTDVTQVTLSAYGIHLVRV